jgi:hypothetical protein
MVKEELFKEIVKICKENGITKVSYGEKGFSFEMAQESKFDYNTGEGKEVNPVDMSEGDITKMLSKMDKEEESDESLLFHSSN